LLSDTNRCFLPDWSRPSGFKSSLKRVHLKIFHALKALSCLTVCVTCRFYAGMASDIPQKIRAIEGQVLATLIASSIRC
jgi:hypothetical protein